MLLISVSRFFEARASEMCGATTSAVFGVTTSAVFGATLSAVSIVTDLSLAPFSSSAEVFCFSAP